MRRTRFAAMAALISLMPGASAAQVLTGSTAAPRRGTWEVGGGGVWLSGFDLGDVTAELTRNGSGSAGRFDLFSADGALDPAAGVQARLGFYLSPSVAVEGGVRYARPRLAFRITGDAEGAEDITAEERLSHYVVDGSLVYHFTRAAFAGGRGLPFVMGGAGYLRELHDGNELVETGSEYHAGAGVKMWFGAAAARRLGLRGEGGVSVRDGGFTFNEERRIAPVGGLSLIYLF